MRQSALLISGDESPQLKDLFNAISNQYAKLAFSHL